MQNSSCPSNHIAYCMLGSLEMVLLGNPSTATTDSTLWGVRPGGMYHHYIW